VGLAKIPKAEAVLLWCLDCCSCVSLPLEFRPLFPDSSVHSSRLRVSEAVWSIGQLQDNEACVLDSQGLVVAGQGHDLACFQCWLLDCCGRPSTVESIPTFEFE
jgi:hypothetical protein